MHTLPRSLAFGALFLLATPTPAAPVRARDHHSHANPEHVRVRHVDLALDVDFGRKSLRGSATLRVERTSADRKQPLVLDSRGLRVSRVESSADGRDYGPAPFGLGKSDPVLGEALTVRVPPGAKYVRVHYATGPRASGLQWLDREQTAGKRHPYLFTQSQAVHARSWIPLQDSPGVRVTYSAR